MNVGHDDDGWFAGRIFVGQDGFATRPREPPGIATCRLRGIQRFVGVAEEFGLPGAVLRKYRNADRRRDGEPQADLVAKGARANE